MILVDTNAWIRHLRARDAKLVRFLIEQRVHTCDVVLGELLLGVGLPKTFAADLRALPKVPSPTAAETRGFIERHARSLAGSGVGWADAQILLSAQKAGARIYSSDRAVRALCARLAIAHA
ncbi:MAG: PIN domain-containing protein [Deltaproteobacteria bacterium]|nr:PIN domain-containing protein [Deltaproteobacteria bacterium]